MLHFKIFGKNYLSMMLDYFQNKHKLKNKKNDINRLRYFY